MAAPLDSAIETYRGVVNTWECDEMGHMNVRFYISRASEGARTLACAIGLGPHALRTAGHALVLREHHVRFHREAHPGQPLLMRGWVVSAASDVLVVYQELARPDEEVPCATFRSELALVDARTRGAVPFATDFIARAAASMGDVPEHGREKGMELTPPRAAPTLAEAEASGMYAIYRGLVRPTDVDEHGRMSPEAFMGSISDGVPHFFRAVGGLTRDPQKGIGGAALEYRLVYRGAPVVGDVLVIRSGLKAQRGKVTSFCHYMFDAETGACVMTSEAIAVLFDMKARKSISPPDDVIASMNERAIPGLRV